ncbi:hypothetical protein FRIGORI9N_90018 [Frigoribacterium sp. 9N]|nr:hypothetical protein FRIGORI9N_90018 [Frigoribacterium sp. 9N]
MRRRRAAPLDTTTSPGGGRGRPRRPRRRRGDLVRRPGHGARRRAPVGAFVGDRRGRLRRRGGGRRRGRRSGGLGGPPALRRRRRRPLNARLVWAGSGARSRVVIGVPPRAQPTGTPTRRRFPATGSTA